MHCPCPTRSTVTRLPCPSRRSRRCSSSLIKNNPSTVPAPARVVIESVRPQVDGGRYPVKRVVGEEVLVEADVFADGHDQVAAELLYKFDSDRDWKSIAMDFRHN